MLISIMQWIYAVSVIVRYVFMTERTSDRPRPFHDRIDCIRSHIHAYTYIFVDIAFACFLRGLIKDRWLPIHRCLFNWNDWNRPRSMYWEYIRCDSYDMDINIHTHVHGKYGFATKLYVVYIVRFASMILSVQTEYSTKIYIVRCPIKRKDKFAW